MLQFHNNMWTSKCTPLLCWIGQSCIIDICRSIEDKCAALDSFTSHQSPQATWTNGGQSKWTRMHKKKSTRMTLQELTQVKKVYSGASSLTYFPLVLG